MVTRLLAILAVMAGFAGRIEAQKQTEHVLELHVIDKKTKEPLRDAVVSINTKNGPNRKDGTDAQGRCWIILPSAKSNYLHISAKLDGYVKKTVEWRSEGVGDTIPETYTLSLEAGVPIGGIIQDEQGQPIDGATVHLMLPNQGDQPGKAPSPREFVSMDEAKNKSGPDGKWGCDTVPENFKEMYVRLEHPQYVGDEYYGSRPLPAPEELKAMTAVMVMKKGLELKGIVTDKDGKGIKGASVLIGADRFGSDKGSMKTDGEGKFFIGNAKPGPLVLTVKAKGFSPDLRQVEARKDMPLVEFKLEPGRTVRGRLVDVEGNPVRGAFVAADTWRGNRSLEYRVDSDANGRFVWKEAPADEVLFDFGKQGFQSLRRFAMKPQDDEYVIKLLPPLRVSGAVTDADTGKPIDSFQIIPGIIWADQQQVNLERYGIKPGADGKYTMEFSEPYPSHVIRIEAEGYLPMVSRGFKDTEGSVSLDFKLKKGTGPKGIVKLPNGEPAVSANVTLYNVSSA